MFQVGFIYFWAVAALILRLSLLLLAFKFSDRVRRVLNLLRLAQIHRLLLIIMVLWLQVGFCKLAVCACFPFLLPWLRCRFYRRNRRCLRWLGAHPVLLISFHALIITCELDIARVNTCILELLIFELVFTLLFLIESYLECLELLIL
jgi:hypothetical protein